jgi:hypothetical protein
VIAGDSRVGDHQIFVDFAAYAEGSAVEDNVFLFVPLHQHQRGKHTRAGALRSSYRIQDHGKWRESMLSLLRKPRR